MEKFKQLGLSDELLHTIKEANFQEPSEIQYKTIPLALAGKDVLGSSATGSGKTLAFGAGIIQNIVKSEGLQALVLTPTRELAEQVARNLRLFSHKKGLLVEEVYGGVSFDPQVRAIRRAHIIVGTPGRILDHLSQRTLSLKTVRFLVLDEADRMLDMGFIEDVEEIIGACPPERQTLLFSATLSPEIEHMARKYMKHPVRVEVEPSVDPKKLQQTFYDVPQNMKFSLLVHLLQKEKSGLVMVFCNTRRTVDMVARNLTRYNIHALPIHGGLTQNRRNQTMQSFHSHDVLVLVCTDVAARGLDVKNVSHVYNYDIPPNSTEYVHRIGRTARAGKEGIAINIVGPRDYENFRQVTRDRSLKIQNQPLPALENIPVTFVSREGSGGRSGGSFRGGSRDSRGGRRDSRSFSRGGRSAPRSFSRGAPRYGGGNRSFGRR